jgi:hypothetical protein
LPRKPERNHIRSTLSVAANFNSLLDILATAKHRSARSDVANQSTDLVRFVLLHALVGAALGIGIACALLLTNAAGLCSLIVQSDDPITPLIMLLTGFGSTIGGLYVASAVMLLGGEE